MREGTQEVHLLQYCTGEGILVWSTRERRVVHRSSAAARRRSQGEEVCASGVAQLPQLGGGVGRYLPAAALTAGHAVEVSTALARRQQPSALRLEKEGGRGRRWLPAHARRARAARR